MNSSHSDECSVSSAALASRWRPVSDLYSMLEYSEIEDSGPVWAWAHDRVVHLLEYSDGKWSWVGGAEYGLSDPTHYHDLDFPAAPDGLAARVAALATNTSEESGDE